MIPSTTLLLLTSLAYTLSLPASTTSTTIPDIEAIISGHLNGTTTINCKSLEFANCATQFGLDIGKQCKIEFTEALGDGDKWIQKAAECVCPQLKTFQTKCLPLCPAANTDGTNLGFNIVQQKCAAAGVATGGTTVPGAGATGAGTVGIGAGGAGA
ncbi:hypothetical protein HDV05_006879, partial [Chytridiales sp. JEL 0842]